jgi:hypothetical protein
MFFDDVATLNTIINYGRTDMKYKEDRDPDVDRLYSSSPSILEQCMQYEMARAFGKTATEVSTVIYIHFEYQLLISTIALRLFATLPLILILPLRYEKVLLNQADDYF